MSRLQEQVKEFHEAFGINSSERPCIPKANVVLLRKLLIDEEFIELKEAFDRHDLVQVADALGDLLYVVYGAALACGLDMDPITDEIHRSNMSKIGGHKDESGKWIKPATYSPANLKPIIDAQL